MLNRDFIGDVSPPTSIVVEASQLRLFNKSIGESRRVYLDESAAKSAGYRSILAPPTFGNCLYTLAPRTGPSYEDLGMDFKFLLHGEESYEYFGEICAGDTVTIQNTITDIYGKRNNALEFIVTTTTFTNQLNELVLKRRQVSIMRYLQD